MKIQGEANELYSRDTLTAQQGQRLAHRIAFAPMVFQVSRLMLKHGVLAALTDAPGKGLSLDEIAQKTGLSEYATKCLIEASMAIGTVYVEPEKELYHATKAGWFLQNDPMVQTDINFVNDVCYQGLFSLDEAISNGRPEGLKVFGEWPTIYQGLSELPPKVQESWFGFDHYYSDQSFKQALITLFHHNRPPKRLMDVGGNTGRWASKCVAFDQNVQVMVVDLPQQLKMMREHVDSTLPRDQSARIVGWPTDLLKEDCHLPKGCDTIWMSQFLDCFSEEQIKHILRKALEVMTDETTLYVMETFWDRQKYEAGSFAIAMTSLYFTAMANGNSKMFHSDDLLRLINGEGLRVTEAYDNLGVGGHTILKIKKQ